MGLTVLSRGRTLKFVFLPLFHMEEKKEAEVKIQRKDSPKVSEFTGPDFLLPLTRLRLGTGKGEREGEAGVGGRERRVKKRVQVLWCLFLPGH